mmetsp:Transcript_63419/g.148935  ORF Transcript_63419/g.148935 Transcript_63419/m.148935 type:complete len:219 (+) Transcript_63419:1575-2231(+)
MVLAHVHLLGDPTLLGGFDQGPGQVQLHAALRVETLEDRGVGHAVLNHQLQEAVAVGAHTERHHRLRNQLHKLLLTVSLLSHAQAVVLGLDTTQGLGALLDSLLLQLLLVHLVAWGEPVQLPRRLQLPSVDHLHALHPDDEGELGHDVEDHPAKLDHQVIGHNSETLHTQGEPDREREPRHNQQDRELPEVGVTLENGLLTFRVLLDLQGIVVEHDAC